MWVDICVCVRVQERKQALELWQTTAQELDRLQQVYQRTISDGRLHNAQRQQLKVHFSHINLQDQYILQEHKSEKFRSLYTVRCTIFHNHIVLSLCHITTTN